jgi:hypothetical protein
MAHLTCLARASTTNSTSSQKSPILPVDLDCPGCHKHVLWRDLIRGCYRRLDRAQGRKKRGTRTTKKKAAAVEEDVEVDKDRGLGVSEGEDDEDDSDGGVDALVGKMAEVGLSSSPSRRKKKETTTTAATSSSASAARARKKAEEQKETRSRLEREIEELKAWRAKKAQLIELSD